MSEIKKHLPLTELRQTFRSMRNPKYRVYSAGQFISLAGTWMQNVALSWIVYSITGSPLALGLTQFASNLPLLLFLYFGGLIADRFDKRRILIITQWLDLTQALVLTVLVITGHVTVPILIGLSFFLGCVTAVEIPSRKALVGELVARDDLASAIGINSAIFSMSRLTGPLLAGFFMVGGGAPLCFIANAASYLATIYAFSKLGRMEKKESSNATNQEQLSKPAKPYDSSATTPGAWLKQPHILKVMFLVAATSLFGVQFNLLLPVISTQNFHDTTGAQLAFLSASMGAGAFFGSLLVAARGSVAWLNRRVALAALSLASSIVMLALSHSLILCMLAMAGAGFSLGLLQGGSDSLLQLQVPTELRGRVMSLYATTMLGLGPFASLLAGFTAERLGLPCALYISAFVVTSASLLYLFNSRSSRKTPR